MDEAALLTLSLALTEAAFDGAPLDAALRGFSRCFAADEVMLYRDDAAGAFAEVLSLRMTPDLVAEYRSAGLPTNPRRPAWAAAPFGAALDFDRLVPAEALTGGALAGVMRRLGFPSRHMAGLRIALGRGAEARFSIGRNRGGAFGTRALLAIETLVPHLRAALKARLLLGHGEAGAAQGRAGLGELERLPSPLATLSWHPRRLMANAALRAIAARRDGLAVGEWRLHADDRGADAALEAAAELPRAHAAGQPPLRGIIVPRAGQAAPYRVQAFAVGPGAALGQGVLFAVLDPEAARPEIATLRSMLGLTQAEAALTAELAAGARLADAARTRGIGLETARTQVKAVMAKAGCSRQPDLMRLLARLGGRAPG